MEELIQFRDIGHKALMRKGLSHAPLTHTIHISEVGRTFKIAPGIWKSSARLFGIKLIWTEKPDRGATK